MNFARGEQNLHLHFVIECKKKTLPVGWGELK